MIAEGLWKSFTHHCQQFIITDTALVKSIEVLIPKLLDIVQRLVKELPDNESEKFWSAEDLYHATREVEKGEFKWEVVHMILLESLSQA